MVMYVTGFNYDTLYDLGLSGSNDSYYCTSFVDHQECRPDLWTAGRRCA